MKKMKAAYLTPEKNFEIREINRPQPKDGEVLIRVEHVGVCGADISFFSDGACGAWTVEQPSILGHEISGVVEEVGRHVKSLRKGDLVCVEPGEPCWHCEYCRAGKYNLCPDVAFRGVPGVEGGFREYMTATENMVFRLPEGVGTLEGALVEPLAVGFHAASQSGARPGMSAVIIGSGCIGLMIMAALRMRGVHNIMMTDISEKRLLKARSLGAEIVINAANEHAEERVMEHTNGTGADLVFEVTGSEQGVFETVAMTKRGGTITMVGLSGMKSTAFDMNGLICKEITLKSVFRYANQYPIVLEALRTGAIDLKNMVSDICFFEEIQKGFEHNVKNAQDVIKEVIAFEKHAK